MKTPERTEDIKGDWFEYKLGDEYELAEVAEGTGWCIASPEMGERYLNTKYDEDYDDEEIDDSDAREKFFIFRLENPDSLDGYSPSGVASIRLDRAGKVAEISGLGPGQALEDPLAPIVKEKVMTLPGGEQSLQRFEDKQTPIRLDRKMQSGEDLTKEELSFLYELDRPIATLYTYNDNDPRIEGLKAKYDFKYAIENGADTNKLILKMDPDYIVKNLDYLLEHGADIDNIVNKLNLNDLTDNLDFLVSHGADINSVRDKLGKITLNTLDEVDLEDLS